ncbi:MAG: maleylpyruvate isomerase family mycothiol-dependent enzyme [Rhodococcus sp. (in: high G+C Gram-positive bacteria)]
MSPATGVVADLLAEGDELSVVLSGLSDSEWSWQTCAPQWTIARQVAHLAVTDTASIVSAAAGAGAWQFAKSFDRHQVRSLVDIAVPSIVFGVSWPFRAERGGVADLMDRTSTFATHRKPEVLLSHWQERRHALADALGKVDDETKLTWIGPPMSPATMATARLMETFAHGQDILDTLGVDRVATPRLRHIAGLGVRTRRFAYGQHNLSAPPAPRVELTGPDGSVWSWGDQNASEIVTGTALDFCLLVTQRRHREDCDVVAVGEGAHQWLRIAQAFAGPPGEGRKAGRRPS